MDASINKAAFKALCKDSIEIVMKVLCDKGVWPRPPAARKLRLGHDFYINDLKGVPEVERVIEFIASDDHLVSLYERSSGGMDWHTLFGMWEKLLIRTLRGTDGMKLNLQFFNKCFNAFHKEL